MHKELETAEEEVAGFCQIARYGNCSGHVGKFVYAPNRNWRPMWRCEAHSAQLIEGWTRA